MKSEFLRKNRGQKRLAFFGFAATMAVILCTTPSVAFFSEQLTLVHGPHGLKAQLVSGGTVFADHAGNEFVLTPASVSRERVRIPVSLPRSVIAGGIGCAAVERGVVREEYFVTERGIRQDFVVTQRVEGEGALQLEIEVRGAKFEICGDAVVFQLPDGARYDYTHLAVFDAQGKRLPAMFESATDHSFVVHVDDRDAHYPIRIDPILSDADWMTLGGLPTGLDGNVEAMVFDPTNRVLYVGGTFTSADGTPVANIAAWDGSAWLPLGTGTNGTVRALALDSAGNLYAGGAFTSAGGVSVSNVAKWDGSVWTDVGGGTNGTVYALAVDSSGNLIAGGSFSSAGGVSVNNLAKWDGSAWSSFNNGTNGPVYALCAIPGGGVYVGGFFTQAGGSSSQNLAYWTGSGWLRWASPNGPNGAVRAFAPVPYSNKVVVGGDFTQMMYGTHNRVCLLTNGSTSPTSLSSNLNASVRALAVTKYGYLYVGGDFTSNGTQSPSKIALCVNILSVVPQWQELGSGANNTVRAMAYNPNNDDVFLGGDFTQAGGLQANRVAKIYEKEWSGLGVGANNTCLAAVADASGNVYAAGVFTRAGGTVVNRVAKWNGSTWTPLGSGTTGVIRALALDSSGNLYAGGSFSEIGGVSASNVAKWDGSNWSPLGAGTNGDVWALACDSAGNVYVGGYFTEAGGNPISYLAKWNGATWSSLGVPPDEAVFALVCDSMGNLYAGGAFESVDDTSISCVAKWDGANWYPLGDGLDETVFALALDNTGNLYAGGIFRFSNTTTVSRVAKWDGTAWVPLGAGVDSQVYALAVDPNGGLYVGGAFENAGGLPAKYLAKWDGSNWIPAGSGLSYHVTTLAMLPNGWLFVGGYFNVAGDKPVRNFARLNVLPARVDFNPHE